VNPRVDRFQADFWLAAKDENLFMFGLCRTHQLFNAADGGSIVQDVMAEGLASRPYRQRKTEVPFDQPFILRDESGHVTFEYRVQLDPDSRMTEVARATSFATNANHHQLVDRPGDGMTAVGWMHDRGTHRDLTVATERWNAFTVQWHPEAMQSDPIQQRLLGTAGRRAKLFLAAKRLAEDEKRVTSESIEAWYRSRFGVLDRSDSRWIRRDLIPHWYGKFAATGTVNGR
jgi:gamma-glutamyl-gamma-aminobutyrate hydrolase PuuD